jgi:hypothetical protein
MKFPRLFGYANSSKKNQNPFRLVAKTRSGSSWSGVLPRTPLCTHFLYCISTLYPDAEGYIPERRFPNATHEIRFGYRLNLGRNVLSLLYLAQYDFSSSEKIADWYAEQITFAIANELLDKKTDLRLLLRSDVDYWDWFINYQFSQLH